MSKKSPWFASGVGGPWIRRRMGQLFFSMDAHGLDTLADAARRGPAIVFSNHSGWWDGFVSFMLERHLGFDLHVMMEKKNLDEAPFLRWLGAFDADLASPRRAALALRTTLKILTPAAEGPPQPVLWMFPQGRMGSPHERPLKFQPGLEWVLEKRPEVPAIPMACRYEFMREDRPHIFLRFGAPLMKASTAQLENGLEMELDALHTQLVAWEGGGFERVWRSSLSVNKRWERWWRRMRGGGEDGFEPLNR